jgi:hypothetical protein
LQTAAEKAVGALQAQPREQLGWLGAQFAQGLWHLPVLGSVLCADPATGRVTTAGGAEVGPHWRILVLHYLGVASQPPARPPEVAFADLASARSYAGVYHQRVIGRLCATAGRTASSLQAAAAQVGALAAAGGDLAFDLAPFPRLAARVIWHAPDEEFGASATVLFPRNVESLLCIEDVVVLSERMVSRLGGRPF